MAAELQSLTVSLQDSFSAGATAVAQAADKMAAAFDKAAGSNTTTDTALRTRGQSLDTVTAKIDGAAAATARLEQIDRRYQAQVQVLTAGMQAQGKSAAEIADAIARLSILRDQDATKARAQGDAIESKFTPAAAATTKLAESTNAAASGMRNLSIQVIQGVSGIASGQPVFTTLIQQGHQVADSMLATGQGIGSLASSVRTAFAAIGGFPTVAVLAGVAALYELVKAGNTSLGMLASVQQAVRGNHADFETLGQTVIDVARKVSQSSGLGLDEALATAKALAQGRYFSGTATDLERLARDANDLGAAMGTSAAEGAKVLAQGMEDPAKTAESLASTFSTKLTPELLRQIDLAQKAGDQNKAYTLLLGGLEAAAGGAARNGLSPIAKAWQDLGNAFTGSTQGWKPFTEWLARDFALAIQNVTTLVNTFKDAWNGIKSIPAVTQNLTSQGVTNLAGALGTGDAAQLTSGQANLPSGQIAASLTSSATKDAFVQNWLAAATSAGQQLGVSPQVLLGQWGLETRWGQSAYNNNLGNIKPGSNYAGQTFINPGDQTEYRSYATPQAFADDFVRLLQTGRYSGALNTGSNALAYGRALQTGGYATDPNYAAKLAAAAGGIQVPGSMVDTAKASADAVEKLVAQTRALKEADLAAQLDDVHQKMDAVAASAGTSSEQYRGLQQVEAGIIKAQHDNVDELTATQRATESQLRSTAGLTAAEQSLSAAMEARRQVALQSGLAFSNDDAEQVRTNVLKAQEQEYDRIKFQITESTANQAGMAAAYRQGNQAVIEATAQQSAYTAAMQLFGQNIPAGKFQELVDFYKKLAENTALAQTAQKNLAANDNLAFIQAETDSIGMNSDARTRMLAVMKAEQEMHRIFGKDLPEEAQKYVTLAGATADATAAFQHQQGALNELSGFFDNTFSTISNAITSAFATGNLAALKFKDIAHSVASAVIAEFAKLGLINPLKNLLFGENQQTLLSVGGVIGNLFGGGTSNAGLPAGEVGLTSTASGVSALEGLGLVTPLSGSTPAQLAAANNASTSSGGVGLLQGAGIVGTLAKGVDYLTGGNLISDLSTGFKSAIGFTSGQSIGSYVSSLIGEATTTTTTVAGGAAAGQTVAAAAFDQAATAGLTTSTETIGAIGSAVGTIAKALPYIGVAISVITDLATGNFRGAGLVAGGAVAGAVIGSYIPVIGTAVGAAVGAVVGGIADAFFPQHPLHPFEDIAVDVQGGRLQAGKTLSQIEDTSGVAQQVNAFGDQLGSFISRVGVVITTADMTIGHLGNGIKNFEQFTNLSDLFPRLSFGNDPNDTSNFGVAKGALTGMRFTGTGDLASELTKIAGFADAVSAIGIRLKSVGTDLTNIQIASVAGADQGNNLRTALQHDLTTQTFANVAALDAEINKVNQFVNGTLVGLEHPIAQTSSAITQAVDKINKDYGDAIIQAQAYGLSIEGLTEGQRQATEIVRAAGVQQIIATRTALNSQLLSAGSGTVDIRRAAEANFDAQAQQTRDAFKKLWTDTYGDTIVTGQSFKDAMVELEASLGAQRLQVTRQALAQIQAAYQGVSDTVESLGARDFASRGDQKTADLINFDIKARQERTSFEQSFVNLYGPAITANETYQAQLATLERVQGQERLQVIAKFADAATQTIVGATADQLKQAQASVSTLFTSLHDYVTRLQSGTNSPLSPIAQREMALSQFNAVAGAAAAGDATSASKVTGYGDTLLAASRAVFGSGAGFASDFNRVIDGIQKIVQAPVDVLTNSFLALQIQQQTVSITQAQQATTDAINALRREVMQQTRLMATAA